jgi:hypothetical protein
MRSRLWLSLLFVAFLGLRLHAQALDALQGVKGVTLVAGKTTALRLRIMTVDVNVDRADVVVMRPDGSVREYVFTPPTVHHEASETSVVVRLTGAELPMTGEYFARMKASYQGVHVATAAVDRMLLAPTKDIRLGMDRSWSGDWVPKPNELEIVEPSLRRLAEALPVRDGVAELDADTRSGVRFIMQNAPQPTDPQICPFFVPLAGQTPGDHIDRGISYRFANPGESGGGNAGRYCGSFNWAGVVTYESHMAVGYAHELGHMLGLGHSLLQKLPDADVSNGYDVARDAMYPVALQNMMYYDTSDGAMFGVSREDWETVRRKLLTLDSTGPSGPLVQWSPMESGGRTMNALTAIRRGGDDRRVLFAIDHLGGLIEQAETGPDVWPGVWTSRGRYSLAGRLVSILPVTDPSGRTTVFGHGFDGRVYSRAQPYAGSGWESWQRVTTDPVSGLAITRMHNRQLAMAYVYNGNVLVTTQTANTGGFGPATNLGGSNSLPGIVAIEVHANDALRVFVVGSDGIVNARDVNGSWERYPEVGRVAELKTTRLPGERIMLFMVRADDDRIIVRTQTAANSPTWSALTPLGAPGMRNLQLVRQGNGILSMIGMAGSGTMVYLRHQPDPSRPGLWSSGYDAGLFAASATATGGSGELTLFGVERIAEEVQPDRLLRGKFIAQ